MAKSKKKLPLVPTAAAPFHNPFAALGGVVHPDPPSTTHAASTDPTDLRQADKATVRRERKGRAGKTVTLITGLALSDAQLAGIARQMRQAFGCGASVEDHAVVLQGDHTERATQWLHQAGVSHVSGG